MAFVVEIQRSSRIGAEGISGHVPMSCCSAVAAAVAAARSAFSFSRTRPPQPTTRRERQVRRSRLRTRTIFVVGTCRLALDTQGIGKSHLQGIKAVSSSSRWARCDSPQARMICAVLTSIAVSVVFVAIAAAAPSGTCSAGRAGCEDAPRYHATNASWAADSQQCVHRRSGKDSKAMIGAITERLGDSVRTPCPCSALLLRMRLFVVIQIG